MMPAGRPTRAADVQHDFDAATLAPSWRRRTARPTRRAVAAHADTRIDVAYIGACTGAKLDDLRFAAQVLRGRRCRRRAAWVAPASLQDRAQAEARGHDADPADAGAEVLPSACGACAGYGDSFAEGPDRDLQHGAQLQGPHGVGRGTQVYLGLGLHRGRLGAARAHHRSARGAGMNTRRRMAQVWHLGDDVDTDALAPGAYMQLGIEGIAPHCLENLGRTLRREVRRATCSWPGATSASAPRASRPRRCWCTWAWRP
jgi:hypothetical protein